jgi:hypothetical protein
LGANFLQTYRVNLKTNQWSINTPEGQRISAAFGTRAVVALGEPNQEIVAQIFSGMIMGKANSGIKICLTTMHSLKLDKGTTYQTIGENVGNIIITGRRSHAMSSQTGRIHMTGGVEAFGKLLHDMWQYHFE